MPEEPDIKALNPGCSHCEHYVPDTHPTFPETWAKCNLSIITTKQYNYFTGCKETVELSARLCRDKNRNCQCDEFVLSEAEVDRARLRTDILNKLLRR